MKKPKRKQPDLTAPEVRPFRRDVILGVVQVIQMEGSPGALLVRPGRRRRGDAPSELVWEVI